jgi:tight adherence protein C
MSDALVIGIGLGWGVLAALPWSAQMGRRAVRRHAGARPAAPERTRRDWGPVGRVGRGLLRRRAQKRGAIARDRQLPAALDLLVVAVASGAPPRAAVEVAARWAPPLVAAPLREVVATVELGGSLTDALAEMGQSSPQLRDLADVLIASARLGAPAGSALGRLADEARAGCRRRAEARARTLPVKLLFPLVFLVLPAFGLLTVAPALLSALSRL